MSYSSAIHTDLRRDGASDTLRALEDPFRAWASLDAIIILGASMNYDLQTKKWKLDSVVHDDPAKVVGGHSRAVAARQICDSGFTGLFLITGGTQQDAEGKKVSRADVMSRIMMEKYKISQTQIAVIGTEGRGNTLGNIADVVDFLSKNDSIISHERRVGLLTNEWHIARTLLMFTQEPFFREKGIEIRPLIVDEILKERSEHHEAWVEAFQRLPEMQQRMELERNGLRDYLEGRYRPKCF